MSSVNAGTSRQEPLLSLVIDIDEAGRFCDRRLEIDGDAIRITEHGNELRSIPLARISELRAEGLVGNGRLIAVVDGEEHVICRYTSRHLAAYSDVARQLNQKLQGEEIVPVLHVERRACPKCGRHYPDESGICPHCLNKVAVLARLWSAVRPHFGLFIVATVFFWLLMALRLVVPPLQGSLANVLTSQEGTMTQLFLRVGLLILASVATNVLRMLQARVMATLSSVLSRDLRAMVYSRIQELSLNYIMRKKTGDLMNRVRRDTATVQRFIQHQAAAGINEVLIFVGVAVIMFSVNWKLALFVILPTPLVVVVATAIRHKIRRMYHQQWRASDQADSLLQDVLSGIRVVKAFGQERREVQRFIDYSTQVATITARNEKAWNTLFPSLRYFMGIGTFIVLYYGGHLVLGQRMDLGELVMFSSYASMMYGPLEWVSFFPRWFTEAMTAAERIFEVIDAQPDIADAPDAVDHVIEGRIEFRDVTFGYEKHKPVLEHINLVVEPGEMIGLVGHSGAGKSTLINLVCRFYDVDEGQILIDGIDIRRISQRFLRSQIGVVLQETFLFSGTIYENIAYAKPGATPEEVIRAAKIANAHDFIMRFTDGYDTLVGERGQRLSGGERQRIAIARAILHNPKILILDEATSSVDTETEYQIQEALARLVKNRTTIAIAHRLSTLRNADRLVVLEKGRIAEMGTHAELMKKKGIYYRLVMAQREMSRVKAIDG